MNDSVFGKHQLLPFWIIKFARKIQICKKHSWEGDKILFELIYGVFIRKIGILTAKPSIRQNWQSPKKLAAMCNFQHRFLIKSYILFRSFYKDRPIIFRNLIPIWLVSPPLIIESTAQGFQVFI